MLKALVKIMSILSLFGLDLYGGNGFLIYH